MVFFLGFCLRRLGMGGRNSSLGGVDEEDFSSFFLFSEGGDHTFFGGLLS